MPTIGREFGRVTINGQDVAAKLVSEGWLKTRQTAPQGASGRCVVCESRPPIASCAWLNETDGV